MITAKNQVFLIITVAIFGSLLYFFYDPSFSFFPPCPFFTITGLYCPGCGAQRAFHDLLHGNLLSSASHNLLFVAALPLVGYSAFVTTNNIFRSKKMQQRIFYAPRFSLVVLVVVLVFAVLRNIPILPFLWLAP